MERYPSPLSSPPPYKGSPLPEGCSWGPPIPIEGSHAMILDRDHLSPRRHNIRREQVSAAFRLLYKASRWRFTPFPTRGRPTSLSSYHLRLFHHHLEQQQTTNRHGMRSRIHRTHIKPYSPPETRSQPEELHEYLHLLIQMAETQEDVLKSADDSNPVTMTAWGGDWGRFQVKDAIQEYLSDVEFDPNSEELGVEHLDRCIEVVWERLGERREWWVGLGGTAMEAGLGIVNGEPERECTGMR
ncbi:hypothetical protein B0T14DRAFT_306504 [Immersiella caudata]|uniref:Uncharacterized protein n=1 Tax=Immersiella caudata TaxID=314043 RepID=A0AA39WF60_9PEZI|nr:hypothetical protein B0T14DRAFT_306504 [Immersiella caudata]